MESAELLVLLKSTGALRSGHFQLSSGRHSRQYVQCALLLERPARARLVGQALADFIRSDSPESIVAPALGGLIVGYEVAAALDVPFRFTERCDGRMSLRRGFSFRRGERVVVIEDVVTTGKSTLETIEVVAQNGAAPVAIGAIIDRTSDRKPFALPFRSLVQLGLESFEPSKCPDCLDRRPVEKPGSRPAASGS